MMCLVIGIIGLSEPPHPTSDRAFVAKMLNKIKLLKILTGSNICVGVYKKQIHMNTCLLEFYHNTEKQSV
jgi:hypothetical protein